MLDAYALERDFVRGYPPSRDGVSLSHTLTSATQHRSFSADAMRALSFLLLLTRAGARRLHARDIQRLNRDDPVPAGWRLATYHDAVRNNACFNLVLKGWQIAELADGYKMTGGWHNIVIDKMVRACNGCPSPGRWSEQRAHRVVVSFGQDTVLDRERTEHIMRQIRDGALVLLGLTVSFELSGQQLFSLLDSSLNQGELAALVWTWTEFVDWFQLTSRIVKTATLLISLPITLRSWLIQMFHGSI